MENTTSVAQSGPEFASEEWVAEKLKTAQATAEVPTETPVQATAEEQKPTETVTPESPATATVPRWNEVVIPADDETVDVFFRGKPTTEIHRSFKAVQSDAQEQRRKVHELEAKLAAQQAVADLVREVRGPAPAISPVDPYKAVGIDLDTEPILNPTGFYPKHDKFVLQEAEKIASAKIGEFEAKLAAKEQLEREKAAVTWALNTVKAERGLTDDDMCERVGFLLFETTNRNRNDHGEPDKNALFDPAKILAVHDSVFGRKVTPTAAPEVNVPNPPGAKRPAAVETSQAQQPQLKAYEREAIAGAAEALRDSGFEVNTEQMAARYAARLKDLRR